MRKQLTALIQNKLNPILKKYGINNDKFVDVIVPPDKSKGDFSMNTALKLAKQAKCAPVNLAKEIKNILEEEKDWFEKVEIAGPGFINLFISNNKIAEIFNDFKNTQNFQIGLNNTNQIVVIDYSSVNIAKQMHVGHLRSTVIGDVLARILEERGDKVIRQNHLGDWGLPIAMVIYKATPVIEKAEKENKKLEELINLYDLEKFYKEAALESKTNKETADKCHEILVKLQNGDKKLLKAWKMITSVSMKEAYRIYELLDIKLTKEAERGESFYRDKLKDVVEQLENNGCLQESDGAKCVFLEEFKGKDKKPLPVIVVKSDGGYNYATFDLAALKYRSGYLKAERIIYVTDARQSLHFKQVFAVAKKCKLVENENVKLEHVAFGTILGENNKPLKTRSGENVKLAELLNEAIEKAYETVKEKNPSLSETKKREVAKIVGIGAVKYADLSQNRNNDYVFSFDRMLALNGNTAPYLQYAHARICSIFRKAQINMENVNYPIKITCEEERDLIIKLMQLPQTIEAVASELRPHILCNYTYELASTFSVFYNKCQVLNCENSETKNSRLALCAVTGKAIAKALSLLGISAPQEM